MNHLAKPLEALAARAGAFVSDQETRVLYVSVDQDLAEAAVEIVVGQEWHPENPRPIFLLAAPYSRKSPGWLERAGALREEYERRQDAFDREAITLPELPPLDESAEPLVTFAFQLKSVADAFSDEELGTKGVIVVLAPESIEGAVHFARELRGLAEAPSLSAVRWIWIQALSDAAEREASTPEALGEAVWRCACHVDAGEAQKEASDLLGGMTTAVASGAGFPAGARPKVAPPPHPDDPPAVPPPADGRPSAHAFLVPFLKAIQCQRDGGPLEAIRLLGEARDLCVASQRPLEAAQMELLAALAIAQAGLQEGAGIAPSVPVFQSAVERAEKAELPGIAATAAMVLGTFANLAKDPELAATSFMRSAALARKAAVPMLEFQALRMAGELGVKGGARERGGERLKDAIGVAAALPPADAQAAGLTDATLDLLAFCKEHGLDALARHAEASLVEEV